MSTSVHTVAESSAASDLLGAVDERYIAQQIDAFAALTASTVGVTRLAYSPLERRAHEHFAAQMRSFGLVVSTDAAGNTIAELPGTEPHAAVIGTGSHLDSVPSGGRFDGVAGVVAAMAVAKAAGERHFAPRRAWRFVAFAGEEGARFGQACNGSRIIAGSTATDDLGELVDADGISLREAMESVGIDPSRIAEARWSPEDWAAFVELHIEQGGLLAERSLDVGVVTRISGSTRLRVRIEGVASHSGATPMHLRHDALVTAAACILAGDATARDVEHDGTRVTVGTLEVEPGSITTIPGEVQFTVDIRDIDGARQRQTARLLADRFAHIAAADGTTVVVETMADIDPEALSEAVASVIATSADAVGARSCELPSGASHDSQQIGRVTAAGMIFVPSRGGLSHVPEEFTATHEIATGVRVLLETMTRLDVSR
ncbi:Zn-dependent hydrolase [Microbacterium protaetiae]|uniref:Zn-dependent hydrolase n=1 Tax=Microbacterium protaetiae TaxID=2509458 RepID=A0A4P6E9J9_9MICO|nr:Zn-dependent hydrolase [Microbacterium protaetiae]QAY58564.1 Zn-dependent hydrolase [Microbacterium protaetiae]